MPAIMAPLPSSPSTRHNSMQMSVVWIELWPSQRNR